MDTFAEVADERRAVADLLSGLSAEQLATQSLCSEWSVHDVGAHLVMPLVTSTPKVLRTLVTSGGSFDRMIMRLTREQARRPTAEIAELLRRNADSRFTPPGGGPEGPLTDLLVHQLDISWPLGLTTRQFPAERQEKVLTWLTTPASKGVIPKDRLTGLRLEADDLEWSAGDGPVVRGSGEALLLGMTGRLAAFDFLEGDGVATLRARLS